MATLREEIEIDIFTDEIENDLFESVKFGKHKVLAMVEIVGVANEFEEMGGAEFGAVIEFTFRRIELIRLESDLSMFGKAITYNDRIYDVNEVFERSEHPKITVIGTLRNKKK